MLPPMAGKVETSPLGSAGVAGIVASGGDTAGRSTTTLTLPRRACAGAAGDQAGHVAGRISTEVGRLD